MRARIIEGVLFGMAALGGCGEEEQIVEPGAINNPRFDHVPANCDYVSDFLRTADDSTETITITFEGWNFEPSPSEFAACKLEPTQGVTFGVVGGAIAVDDSIWVGYADAQANPQGPHFFVNEPSSIAAARVHRSRVGDLFFEPRVSSVGFHYCAYETDELYVYALSATGAILDWTQAAGLAPGGMACSVWDTVGVQATSDEIAQVRVVAAVNPLIDDLRITRRIVPEIACDTVQRAQMTTCRINKAVDTVSEWHFEVPADNIHVTSTTSETTWAGIAVLSGRVWAAVTIGGQADTLSGSLQVTDRTDPQWRWDGGDWDFDPDAPPLPLAGLPGQTCENYGPFYREAPAKLGEHRRRTRCVGGRIEPYMGVEGGVEAGYDAIPVSGGGPNDGLWYVVDVHYTMDTAASVNPFLKAGYSPSEFLDPDSLKQKCKKDLGTGPPYSANFYDYNTKCGSGDPFAVGNLGYAILAHEGMGTKSPTAPDANGHEARLRLGAADSINDPNRAVERLVGSDETDLIERVRQEIQRVDGVLDAAGDPNHVFVKDNFLDKHGGCGLAHVYRTSSNHYVLGRVFEKAGQCL